MKISYNWLKSYINIDLPVEKVASILTDTGLEVEKVHKIETIPGGLAGLTIGKVLSKEKHADADRLQVTTVDVGAEEPFQIVCGAPNVDAGQTVVVALPGTTIYPTEGDPFKIKKSKIRGVESSGMICAEDEIGLGTKHDGIMVLDEEVTPGTPARDYFNVEDDFQLEIGLTPNRADGMSHIGVARDLLCALKHQEIIPPATELQWPLVDGFSVDKADAKIEIEVKDSKACPRYAGVEISDVSVSASPEWLQNKLRSIGLNPINNVVDITNFVLHETGQPLHAFDANVVNGKVIVQQLPEGSTFTTLDEVERKLSSDDLMICNQDGGMCIAGVFGGMKSGVMPETKNIFLESAYFDPVSVRKTAKRHGLNTDASFRFERGIDPNLTIYALKRAAILIREVCGGIISSEITDIYPNPVADFKVDFHLNYLKQISGVTIPEEQVENILSWLDIKITKKIGDKWSLEVPAYRVDVVREIDVVEEILRIYGFNNIPVPEKVNTSLSFSEQIDKEKLQNIVSDLLTSNGFSEAMSNSLTRESYSDLAGDTHITGDRAVKMLNPLSTDLGVLRQTMLYSGLEAIRYNQNRQESDLKLYEFGKTYSKMESGYSETNWLSLFLTGKNTPETWSVSPDQVSFYTVKGAAERVLQRLGILKNHSTKSTSNKLFTDGIELSIARKKVADIGWIKTSILEQMDISQPVYYAEINWDTVLKLMKMNKTKFKPVSKYPSVRRDLSLLLDKSVQFSEISEVARKSESKLLKEVDLFDVYEGKNLPTGKKSYAVKFILHDEEATLKDKKIDAIMSKIQKQLNERLGAELR